MYTINTKLGIGEIIEENETTYTVYFAEADEEKKLLKMLVSRIFDTIEEAENALNPELTEEEIDEISENAKKEASIMTEGVKASHIIERIEQERSKNLMKHI